MIARFLISRRMML